MPEQDVVVPEVAESVAEVTILNWHKGVGEFVEADEALAEVETDKANVDMPAPFSGVVTAHVAAVGDTLAIGEVVARIDTDKTEGAAPAEQKSADAGSMEPAESSGTATSDEKLADLSPAVRRIVSENGIDPADVEATGPGGRLTKEDVLSYVDKHKTAQPTTPPKASESTKPGAVPQPASDNTPAPAGVSSVGAGGQTTRRVAMSKIRRSIARNLLAAQQNAAILTTFNEVDLTEVMALRKKYKEPFGDKHGVGLGFMSFFSKAAAVALAEFERVNARIDGDDIVYHDYVNLGVAVSTERGLVVPVIKDVQAMSFATVEKEIKRVALAARDGKIGLAEMSGGTFTITNGGVFGSLLSTPIINAPQSGILGMHTIQQRPMAVDGEVKIRPMMYVALSYDHRIVDGKESVSFLVRLKQLLEDPSRLLLDV
ncbi:MAG: 2-oxoglutarate dehydrogenase complex dihydrolipoyllysine-residue succinyltransferase [Planctomycetota bacterium]